MPKSELFFFLSEKFPEISQKYQKLYTELSFPSKSFFKKNKIKSILEENGKKYKEILIFVSNIANRKNIWK